jgi:two-component system sensor histidine kinase QseC
MGSSSSLRRRLLITLLGAMTLTWVVAAATSYLDIRHEVGELFDAQLAQAALVLLSISTHEVQEQAGFEQSQITDETLQGANEVYLYSEKVAYQIWVEPDNLAARSLSAPAYRLSENDGGFSDRKIDEFLWRVYATKHPTAPITIYTAERHDIRAELTNSIALRMVLPILVALPLLALLVWFGVSHSLKPLKRVTGDVGRRAPANLKPIADPDIPEEIEPLILSMNKLFQRVGQAFENERRFTTRTAGYKNDRCNRSSTGSTRPIIWSRNY